MIRTLTLSSLLMMGVFASAQIKTAPQQCPDICPAIYNPVCGSDGRVYSNPCRLNAASCRVGYTITEAPFSVCGESPSTSTICPDVCAAIYDPVCGSDGRTYGSSCSLWQASCQSGNTITVVSDGECPKRCPNFCPFHYDPVCGSDGKTYSNDCLLDIAICRDSAITKSGDGPCPPKIKCPFGCNKMYSPVCGTDGKTYGNECRLRSVSCVNSTVKLAYVGACVDPSVKCPNCPKNYEPVCGSDGNTYNNRCLLKVATCKNPSTDIKVVYEGRCRNRH